MKTKTLIITVILVAAIVAPLALAAPEDGPRNRGPQGLRGNFDRPGMGMGMGDGNFAQAVLGKMGEELNLTDEQKESIKKIAEESRAAGQENRQAIQKAMQTLNEAAEKGDEAEITAAGKAVGDAFTKQALNRVETTKKVKAVLTEEQIVKLDEIKSKMKEQMQQRREKMRDGEGLRGGPHGPKPEEPKEK